jgi:hypothetical protein
MPPWFKTEVLRRLEGVRPGREPGQFYARCPAHNDRHASLAIRPGDEMPLVYWCHAVPGCEETAIREGLAALGVPEEYLGRYGTPEYEARRKAKASGDGWREVERLRNEMIDLKNMLRTLLDADLTLAMLKVRILAVAEGVEIPAGRKEYVSLAVRGGVSPARAYEAWKADPLGRARTQCVTHTPDHVVLTRPGESSQASQVTGHDGILETRTSLSEREPRGTDEVEDNSRNENAQFKAADKALRDAGLIGGEAA